MSSAMRGKRKIGTSGPGEAASSSRASLGTLFASKRQSTSADSLARKRARSPVAKKRLVIEPFKVKPMLPENFEDDTIARLERAVVAILHDLPLNDSQEELYRCVQNLCLHKLAPKIYAELTNLIENHLADAIQQFDRDATLSDSVFLKDLAQLWMTSCTQIRSIQELYLYLDRTFVRNQSVIRSIWEMGLDRFRKHFCLNPRILDKSITYLLDLIATERGGAVIDPDLIKNLISMFKSISIYESHFEKLFLQSTDEYYKIEARNLSQSKVVSDYLHHVSQRLDQELLRSSLYLLDETQKSLMSIVEIQLVQVHADSLLQKGFDELLDNSDITNLRLMFGLFAKVNLLHTMRESFGDYIKSKGASIVNDVVHDDIMIERLLALKRQLDQVIRESFESNPDFAHSLKESFELCMKERSHKPAELLARYLDLSLKQVQWDPSLIDQSLMIFKFCAGKDIFQAFYTRDLAKRLLLKTTSNDQAELELISRLKVECGPSFTHKWEIMFKDIDLSRELFAKYRATNPASIEFTALVLTSAFWPLSESAAVKIPADVEQSQKSFEAFYTSAHTGRELKWNHQYGSCVVAANFPKGRKEFEVTTLQALVLLLFSDSNRLTFAEITAETLIEPQTLIFIMSTLCKPKAHLLQKRKSGPVTEFDEFQVNSDFQHRLFRIQLSAPLPENSSESKQVAEKVFSDRLYQIDAVVVRIMKSRRQLSHTELVNICFQELKFPIEVADLKTRISSLIDREYISRDTSSSKLYNYVA